MNQLDTYKYEFIDKTLDDIHSFRDSDEEKIMERAFDEAINLRLPILFASFLADHTVKIHEKYIVLNEIYFALDTPRYHQYSLEDVYDFWINKVYTKVATK